jgi:hypothetical protein
VLDAVGSQVTAQLVGEICAGRDRLAVDEHRARPEMPGQVVVQQCTVAVTVAGPIVDEDPRHHTPTTRVPMMSFHSGGQAHLQRSVPRSSTVASTWIRAHAAGSPGWLRACLDGPHGVHDRRHSPRPQPGAPVSAPGHSRSSPSGARGAGARNRRGTLLTRRRCPIRGTAPGRRTPLPPSGPYAMAAATAGASTVHTNLDDQAWPHHFPHRHANKVKDLRLDYLFHADA